MEREIKMADALRDYGVVVDCGNLYDIAEAILCTLHGETVEAACDGGNVVSYAAARGMKSHCPGMEIEDFYEPDDPPAFFYNVRWGENPKELMSVINDESAIADTEYCGGIEIKMGLGMSLEQDFGSRPAGTDYSGVRCGYVIHFNVEWETVV